MRDGGRVHAARARTRGVPPRPASARRTPEGDWYCFEVNPSPAFTYYESRSGQPIGNAVARLLAVGPQGAPEFIGTNEAKNKNDSRETQTKGDESRAGQAVHGVQSR